MKIDVFEMLDNQAIYVDGWFSAGGYGFEDRFGDLTLAVLRKAGVEVVVHDIGESVVEKIWEVFDGGVPEDLPQLEYYIEEFEKESK